MRTQPIPMPVDLHQGEGGSTARMVATATNLNLHQTSVCHHCSNSRSSMSVRCSKKDRSHFPKLPAASRISKPTKALLSLRHSFPRRLQNLKADEGLVII